jgi:hypothetical protein
MGKSEREKKEQPPSQDRTDKLHGFEHSILLGLLG